MEHFNSKRSFEEFSDRELMMLLLANQVKIFREIKYLQSQVETGQKEALGHFSESFKDMISSADSILEQSEEYLSQEDTDKGFLRF